MNGKLKVVIGELYPSEKTRVFKGLKNAFDGKSVAQRRQKNWFRNLLIYVTYPDTFVDVDGDADLNSLREKLGYIKKLGCNCIHLLPFLSSPMIDGGFDVSDYFLVRDELGGNLAFENLLEKAEGMDMSVLMDIVLNHVSYEHRWFQLAVSGDSFYRQFFICQKDKPKLIKRYTDENGVWARYEIEGNKVDMRIIFPEQCGSVPHWNQARDGWWYYHTFYPHQPDVNWDNYHVFIAYAKTLVYWAKKGVSFRLDAVPFVGKDVAIGKIESSERTHKIVKALNLIVKEVNSSCVFLVEANQAPEVTRKYFGEKNQVEAEMAYGFSVMMRLWSALASGDEGEVWKGLTEMGQIDDKNVWVNFLRNHDELTLEFADEKTRAKIIDSFGKKGYVVRDGFGLAGRSFSLLGAKVKRHLMAYALLLSMPGNVALIYGDELGKKNDYKNMRQQRKAKQERTGDKSLAMDGRDINRGVIGQRELKKGREHQVYLEMVELFQARRRYMDFFDQTPERLGLGAGIFGSVYRMDDDMLWVFVNLTSKKRKIPGVAGRLAVEVNGVVKRKKSIELPAYGACWVVGW